MEKTYCWNEETDCVSIILVSLSSDITPLDVSQLTQTDTAICKNENILIEDEPISLMCTPTVLNPSPHSYSKFFPFIFGE